MHRRVFKRLSVHGGKRRKGMIKIAELNFEEGSKRITLTIGDESWTSTMLPIPKNARVEVILKRRYTKKGHR